MGPGRGMCWIHRFVLVIVVYSLTYRADGAPLNVLSAPNLLRVGTTENIFVEIQECALKENVIVEIKVLNHPTRAHTLSTTSVTLSKDNNFQAFGKIKIPPETFNKATNMKQYVYLQAEFRNQQVIGKVVLVSFQSGYIFIQTDKTIYTPNSILQYRMFGVSPGMKPVEKTTGSDASIAAEILTPDGIIVQTESVSLESGIYVGTHQLGEIVSPGLWKVVAKFQSNPQQTYSAEFEVKEYVLPSFEVKLTSNSPYFHVDSETLTITIKAKYLYGEMVTGEAYVVFGLMQDSNKKSFPDSVQNVPIRHGEGIAILKKGQITQTFTNINELVGHSIYVAVSVLTDSGGEMVEAELRGIQIAVSPYKIKFMKTPQYFEPGFSFNINVAVSYPDDTPAIGVPLVVNPGGVMAVTSSNGVARLSVNTQSNLPSLRITAEHSSKEKQTSATMTAFPYNTKGNNYMHIDVDVLEVKLGQTLTAKLHTSGQINPENEITQLIMSKGQLLKFKRYRKTTEQYISDSIVVTKDMLPSFRIIAYYHTADNEVVSDSLWVDVQDTCMGSLTLEPLGGSPPYKPRSSIALKVTGDPGAKVGLVAVDKGVYVLNNKHRLSQKKVWDIVEKYDTGCTPGGGKDSMGVFSDAGLMFVTHTGSETSDRQGLNCPTPSRRKRASTIMDVRTSLVSQYKDKLQRECCLDGIKLTPLSYNCERRSEYITDGAACVQAFLQCCKAVENLRTVKKTESLQLARSEENNDYVDSLDITSRTNFPESWLWSIIDLPPCLSGAINCKTTSFNKQNVILPDSITTWHITAISLSKDHGICITDSLDLIVEKKFFIDLRLPYSAVRGEQLEVKAILHNQNSEPITVRIDLIENTDMCSAAYKRGKFRQEVTVAKESTRSVPFTIIPMKHGELFIEVKAAVRGDFGSDGIKKSLLVVPQGVLTRIPIFKEINPARKGGKQQEVIKSEIPLKDLVPDTPTSTLISLIGREQTGQFVENAISGQSMEELIYQPTGCGEQNMADVTLPVIAAMYLDKTNQWQHVGFKKRDEALQHIKTGFNNQLNYRKRDGSFAIWPDSKSSTWLTAYVAKVFAMASTLVPLQTSIICDAVKFLILNAQLPDGMFNEVGHVYQRSMIGDVEGTDSDASMTAFCLIALQEARTLCSDSVSNLQNSISKSVSYLEKRLPTVTYPYAVAMTSYALANENKLNQAILYQFVSTDLSHWRVPWRHSLTLEATAYALLALVKKRAFEEAKPVVRWFNQQTKMEGGYGSTQATIMVYQAVAEYWATAEEPDYSLNVDILLPGRQNAERYNLNKQNQFLSKTSKFKSINKEVEVTATGKGEATISMVSLYYAFPKESEGNCEKFNMTVQLLEEKLHQDKMTYKLTINLLYKDNERDATMTILDISLLTGTTVDKNDLDLLSKGPARTIANYEMNTVLSERGSLIIYLDKVSHSRPEEISFKLEQTLQVRVMQPAAVSVYEYYNSKKCVKFYRPQRKSGELLTLCRNNECICAEENCSMQKKDNIKDEERTAKACESSTTSKIDYVYKIRVDAFKEDLSTDIYTIHVMQVIKEGSTDVGPQNKSRTYLSYHHCRKSMDLKINKTYLVMGSSKDIYKDETTESYQYMFGERTWIEYWPSEAECHSDKYKPTCVGMEDLITSYEYFGCQH